jgi:hypothetical protein
MNERNRVMNKQEETRDNDDARRSVGTGVGAVVGGAAGGVAAGAAAGAAAGGVTGPLGAVVGAAVGAVAGAVAGKEIASPADAAAEDAYWREHYSSRPYARGSSFDEYRPAFGYGVQAYTRYPNRTFDEVEPELGRDWPNNREGSRLDWDRAKHATRDAWQRVSDSAERATPGDSDRDGK